MDRGRGGGGGTLEMDMAALIDRLPEMIVVINDDLTIKFVNQRLLDGMGYERDAVIGSNIFDYVHPDDHDYMAGTWAARESRPGETGIIIEARGRNADGTWRSVEILGLSLLRDGVIDGMVMTLRDIERKTDKGVTAPRIRAMIDRTTDVVLLLDRNGRIGFANRRLTSRFGVDQDEAVGMAFTALMPDDEHPRFARWFTDLVEAGDRADARIRLILDVAGAVPPAQRTVEWHGTNQFDDPLIDGLILSGRDVTDLVDMERQLHAQTEQLRHSAEHDALTGLINRAAFVDVLSARLRERRAADDRGDAVVLFCDLDRFKQVNDTHGHDAGDHVLRVAAGRILGCLRDGDVVARWGGDEFTVLLEGSPTEHAVDELVRRLRERLSTPMANGTLTTRVGLTVGVSRAPVVQADARELLAAADEAMYARKPTR